MLVQHSIPPPHHHHYPFPRSSLQKRNRLPKMGIWTLHQISLLQSNPKDKIRTILLWHSFSKPIERKRIDYAVNILSTMVYSVARHSVLRLREEFPII